MHRNPPIRQSETKNQGQSIYQDVHGEPRRGTENTEMIEAIRNDLKRLTLDKKSSEKAHQAMLSKALKKADTAVELDNAQDFQGARSAYQEAWNMLQQVVIRMKGDEEKTRLEAMVSLHQGSTVQLTYKLLTNSTISGQDLCSTFRRAV